MSMGTSLKWSIEFYYEVCSRMTSDIRKSVAIWYVQLLVFEGNRNVINRTCMWLLVVVVSECMCECRCEDLMSKCNATPQGSSCFFWSSLLINKRWTRKITQLWFSTKRGFSILVEALTRNKERTRFYQISGEMLRCSICSSTFAVNVARLHNRTKGK